MPSSCLVPTHVVPMEFPFRLTLYMSMFQKISPVLYVLAEILIFGPNGFKLNSYRRRK
jgi:hypothetical protein